MKRIILAFLVIASPNWGYLSPFASNIPQVISGGEWATAISINNRNDAPVVIKISFYDAAGKAWAAPVEGKGKVSSVSVTVVGKGSSQIRISEATTVTTSGWADVDIPCATGSTCGDVAVSVNLRNHTPLRAQDFELNYPALSSDTEWILPFDQSAYQQMVITITHASTYETTKGGVTLSLRDESGNRIWSKVLDLPAKGSLIYNVAQDAKETWLKTGTLEITSTRYIVVSALRINETGSFTPLQAIAP